MPFHRFSKFLVPCLVICTSLAAAPSTSGSGTGASKTSSDWVETLRNLPLVPRTIPQQLDTPSAMLSQAPVICSVEPLPEIADADAQSFERDLSPDTKGLMPAMARALDHFRKLVRMVGGTFELKSAYRPPAYQAHLQAVWYKWMLELRNNREPGCQTLRAQVSDEFTRHNLLETQKPVTSSDHSRGLAFDAMVLIPRIAQLRKRRVSLDRLALLAGISRPDIRHDPVHFRLAVGRVIRHA